MLFGTVATATVVIANNKSDANNNINKIEDKNKEDKNTEEKTIIISKDVDKDNLNKKENQDSSDNINENNNSVQNSINTLGKVKKQRESNVIDSAKSYAVNRFDVEKMVKGTYSGPLNNEKTVFLTFDDGPSKNTPKVLDILKQYGVHGTFFVLGGQVKGGSNYIKRIYNEGNAIGNHSYTHDFATLYPKNKISVSTYMNEYYKTENALKSVLGNNFNTKVVRMPGGENSRQYYKDPNLSELRSKFSSEGIASIDWNALNGDAEGRRYTVSQMVDYVKRSSAGQKHVVVLMHDAATKGLTVEALPQVIEYFKSQGYNFKVIS